MANKKFKMIQNRLNGNTPRVKLFFGWSRGTQDTDYLIVI